MAVRTGARGPGGISLLIVPLNGHPGVTMRRISTGGAATSGTTFIELDDVKVPVENLIAKVRSFPSSSPFPKPDINESLRKVKACA
jgi:alkylation response protein AidB-like acyl-CoA dehydrogenase